MVASRRRTAGLWDLRGYISRTQAEIRVDRKDSARGEPVAEDYANRVMNRVFPLYTGRFDL